MPRITIGSWGAELDRVLLRQAVTQGVQYGSQGGESGFLIREAKAIGDLLQPFMGFLDRAVEHRELAHGAPP
jgi:hypothetical protein